METHTPLRKRAGWPGCAGWGTGVGGPAAEKVGHRGPPRPRPAVAHTRVGETPQGQGRELLPPHGDGRRCVPTRAGGKNSGYGGPGGVPRKATPSEGPALMRLPKKPAAVQPAWQDEGNHTSLPSFCPDAGPLLAESSISASSQGPPDTFRSRKCNPTTRPGGVGEPCKAMPPTPHTPTAGGPGWVPAPPPQPLAVEAPL